MPGITFEYETFFIDTKKIVDKLNAKLEVEMRKAAGEFAKAALKKIPVRTGFAAGSLGALEAILGNQARMNPIISFLKKVMSKFRRSPLPPKITSNVTGEYYYPPGGGKILKTPTSGQQFATPAANIITRNGNLLTFQFKSDITYFNIQDIHPGRSPSAPWQAFAAGRDAFIQYMNNVISKLDDPFKVVLKKINKI